MEKPDVDHIEGLSPAISIEQKSTSHNPRSTVGTITEIYDYLRLLFARVGTPRCPDHGYSAAKRRPSARWSTQVLALANDPGRTALHAARAGDPRAQGRARAGVRAAARAGFRARARRRRAVRARRRAAAGAAPEAHDRSGDRPLQGRATTSSSAWPNRSRPRSSSATAWRRCSRSTTRSAAPLLFSSHFTCPVCDYSLPELEPRLFSFNSPVGACPTCDGLGVSAVLRSGARGRASGSVARRRRGARLGSAQRVLLPADRVARAPLRLQRRHAVAGPAGSDAPGRPARQRQGHDRLHATSPMPADAASAGIASKASCRTSSGATAKPNRPRCARNSPSTSASARARTAAARV